MPFDLAGSSVMEYLWETLDKLEDEEGDRIVYMPEDIEQLWWMGFVDTDRYSMEEWKRVFEPYRQHEGFYLLKHDEFLALDRYRYTGDIHIPFDAMLINEGKYTDEGLDELISASIAPSCFLPRGNLNEFFDRLKKDFRQADSLILIKKEAKERIRALLEQHPSPLRNLEILLDQMIESRGEKIGQILDGAEIDVVTAEAAKQVSSFSSTPTTRVESKAKEFEKLQKVKKKKESSTDDGKPKVELKRIRRSRKGYRG